METEDQVPPLPAALMEGAWQIHLVHHVVQLHPIQVVQVHVIHLQQPSCPNPGCPTQQPPPCSTQGQTVRMAALLLLTVSFEFIQIT